MGDFVSRCVLASETIVVCVLTSLRKGRFPMKRLNIRNLGLVILALLLLVPAATNTQAQANNQVWLAYVDTSGNVWLMTPANAPGSEVTRDADFKVPST